MSVRVDPGVLAELTHYGGDTAVKCFNCGNCTAACALTDQDSVFPRRYIRYIQLGLRDKMLGSLDPWLCYYCGDCSDTCPRDAQPGKLMMAGRRWLISMYDWTGISRLMYKSPRWEAAFIAIVALAVLALFTLPSSFGYGLLASHPEARESVNLAYFAPKDVVHRWDNLFGLVLGALLLSNAARMVYRVAKQGPSIPMSSYLLELREMIVQGLTQIRWRGCATGASKHWLRHLFLVTSYASMFALVMVFLQWFQVEDTGFHWTAFVGYYATAVLLVTTGWIIIDRLRKREQIHKESDLTDWVFVSLLFLTGLSGILLHIARMLDMPMATYALYTAHLMIDVPLLTLQVPFGKWSHILYRPLALYLLAARRRAEGGRPIGVIEGSPLPVRA